jgi:GDPmannose 4,6-dehydratase
MDPTARIAATLPCPRRRALIVGIGGQDGAYLAAHLLACGYDVIGTSRTPQTVREGNLARLGIADRVVVETLRPTDLCSTLDVVARHRPDEIYALACQSSVAVSFARPAETIESVLLATSHLLEAVRLLRLPARLFFAGSSEMFGDTGGTPAHEATPPRPRSPYGIAKAAAFWEVARARRDLGIAACTGILFNHESPLRPEPFVTRKVVAAACEVADGTRRSVALGDLSVCRDWGWAPEYVVAMHHMLEHDEPEDLVIATGVTSSLEDFVAAVFASLGLDWRRHVTRDPALQRAGDIPVSRADPARAADRLGWRARHTMPDVARLLVEAHRPATPLRRAA